ncbi:hypothetical protein B0F90DRAFT_1729588 [Multifurca ochricompacta]|uniref:PCI domain-containing protein n=1 Tax=Multifurca ochricompacta TaxID=376703 RepID=A0AAD4QMN7_9AGAM|nr:hypothetical protein B0F90DRAFT_1729588 [Multifurca ochricompacta]
MSSSAQSSSDRPKPPKLNVEEYLATAVSATPSDLHPFFESFQSLYSRKLWHQLTQKVDEFFDYPLAKQYRVDVYTRFVRDFEERLNPLRLAEMGIKISQDIDNPAEHLEFLTDLLSRITQDNSSDAHVLVLSTLAHAKLLFGDLEGSKTDIDAAWKVLDNLDAVENSVNGAYYRVAADYYKAKAEYAPYYRNSLLYLACVDLEKDMSQEERLLRAHDLALSAFLAETIYNFGELLMHPILDSLDGTPHEWIKKLLFTFNEGNIGKFEAQSPLFGQEPILMGNYPFLRQKICLMALIESVFARGAYDRTMSFQTISEETRLPLDEVEHLIMKALSLKLIRGSIDQVDQKAVITWVQPRVLSRSQIGKLAERLDTWKKKLDGVAERIAPELLVSS